MNWIGVALYVVFALPVAVFIVYSAVQFIMSVAGLALGLVFGLRGRQR